MADKLFALAGEVIEPDNLDALCYQELLLGGHLYLMVLRELLENTLQMIKARFVKDANAPVSKPESLPNQRDLSYLRKIIASTQIVGSKLSNFLSTGTIKSQSGLDLMQDKGFVVMADKLNNFRFLAHFRAVHRGAYFTEMKTTTVRKLLP
jgi:DNA-directed RNA polymerase I subunit RPA2